MAGAKMRVYEIAREVGLPNKELISKIRALGLEVNNHMSALDPEDVARVKRSLEKERLANTETARLSSTVLRRRSKSAEGGITAPSIADAELASYPAPSAPGARAVPPRVVAEPAPPVVKTRRRAVAAPAETAPAPTSAHPEPFDSAQDRLRAHDVGADEFRP